MEDLPALLFRLSNVAIWIGFLYLAYHTACLYAATFSKRAAFRRGEKSWVAVGNALLGHLYIQQSPTSDFLAVVDRAWANIGHWSDPPSPVLKRLVDYAARGDFNAAFRVMDEHLAAIATGPQSQRSFAGHATRLGLLGTIVGVAECFALAKENLPEISSLGFALATTAVGLILAVFVEVCVQHLFEPSFARFTTSTNHVRDQLCLRLLQLRTLCDSGSKNTLVAPAVSVTPQRIDSDRDSHLGDNDPPLEPPKAISAATQTASAVDVILADSTERL
ncbi:MAG: MotA/TolQ/ExbB proton channel family protein [Planctomycetia bacterium]|nr:MotA/TolQ/ExbB proton channel family protein [Planctomycetia bacterium]